MSDQPGKTNNNNLQAAIPASPQPGPSSGPQARASPGKLNPEQAASVSRRLFQEDETQTSEKQNENQQTKENSNSDKHGFIFNQVEQPVTRSETVNFNEEHVLLEACTGNRFKCRKKAACMSANIRMMIELLWNGSHSGDKEDNMAIIPLVHEACTDETVKRIITFCEYHCDEPDIFEHCFDDFEDDEYEIHNRKLMEFPSYWDQGFIEAIPGNAELYDLLIAAHYLQISPIVDVGSKVLCLRISGRSCDEVRAILNIPDDQQPPQQQPQQ